MVGKLRHALMAAIVSPVTAYASDLSAQDRVVNFQLPEAVLSAYRKAYDAMEEASEANYAAPIEQKQPTLAALAIAEDAFFSHDAALFDRFHGHVDGLSENAPVIVAYHSSQDRSSVDRARDAVERIGVDLSVLAVDYDAYPTLGEAYSYRAPSVQVVYDHEIFSDFFDENMTFEKVYAFLTRSLSELASQHEELVFEGPR